MENDKIYLDLVTQNPINYNGLIIYQPSFDEIIKYGLDNYYQIMQVYSLTIDCFSSVSKEANLFDDIIIQDQRLLLCLSQSLYFLTKVDSIVLYSESKQVELQFKDKTNNSIQKTFVINSSNFDDISNIILKINASQKVAIEKPPENMSERQKDIWNKLQEGRKKDAQKNSIHIYDILNVCEFGGNYHIPIDTICNWSLWRIMNCYKARTGWKRYDDSLQIALVSRDDKSISGENYWHRQLMIRE